MSSSSEEAPGLEARRRGRKVGRESNRFTSEETQEAKGNDQRARVSTIREEERYKVHHY